MEWGAGFERFKSYDFYQLAYGDFYQLAYRVKARVEEDYQLDDYSIKT